MARGVNKVILVGNLGNDPEVRYTPSGAAVANFNLATNYSFKNKEGNWEDQTEWHRIVLWSRLAEVAKEYASKGSRVYIEGRLQTRNWEDQSGQKRYTTEIIANDLQLLDSRGEGGPTGGGMNPADAPAQNFKASLPADDDQNPDDVPF